MRIAYFINTFKSMNWGGQATSNGIKKLVEQTYPDAEFVPLNLPSFPLNKIRIFRSFWEKKLAKAILDDDRNKVVKNLKKLNIDEAFFNGFDTVCFNGEGAVHAKSGHLIRLLGILYEFKKRGAFVAALNQTVDLGDNELLKEVLHKVYSMVDYLAVREPVSQRELQKLGLEPALIGDAAYALGKFSDEKVASLIPDLKLPPKFIAVTGSSYLKRNKKSIKMMDNLLSEIEKFYQGIPIYFLANAKTDIYLAHKLQSKYRYTIFAAPEEKYERAIAVIAKAHLVIGGRQHPNIFAAMQGVPFIPLQGNTHKMEGVVELLEYPIEVLEWRDHLKLNENFKRIEKERERLFNEVKVPELSSIRLDPSSK
ncbi:MAG: polysaccharide pyruvyl transferase family protein [Campylobacterales bacterium]|nr:polysaccharide pyruvyl transferase family protein [Campylobacterales bacterium]